MFGHLPELLIVLVLGLVFFGPEKLPEIAAQTGKMIRELRLAMNTAMEEPHQYSEPEDAFATYYYDSQARSGEEGEDPLHDSSMNGDSVDYANSGDEEFDDNWKSILNPDVTGENQPVAEHHAGSELVEESERPHGS